MVKLKLSLGTKKYLQGSDPKEEREQFYEINLKHFNYDKKD